MAQLPQQVFADPLRHGRYVDKSRLTGVYKPKENESSRWEDTTSHLKTEIIELDINGKYWRPPTNSVDAHSLAKSCMRYDEGSTSNLPASRGGINRRALMRIAKDVLGEDRVTTKHRKDALLRGLCDLMAGRNNGQRIRRSRLNYLADTKGWKALQAEMRKAKRDAKDARNKVKQLRMRLNQFEKGDADAFTDIAAAFPDLEDSDGSTGSAEGVTDQWQFSPPTPQWQLPLPTPQWQLPLPPAQEQLLPLPPVVRNAPPPPSDWMTRAEGLIAGSLEEEDQPKVAALAKRLPSGQ